MSHILSDELQFHLRVKKGDVGKYVILCGDPGRVEKIAAYLDKPYFVASNREYTIYNGYLKGEKITVSSTGIGGPSAAICVEELIKCGAEYFIRVGTSGGMRDDVIGGDLCVAMAAIRDEGTSGEYLPASFPAVSDFFVTKALCEAAAELSDKQIGNSYHVGTVHSKDSFYGETNPETMAISGHLINRWNSEVKLGCLCSEMECAALFSVCQTRGAKAGAVLLAIWNVERTKNDKESPVQMDTSRAIKCAIKAYEKLIK